MASEVLQSLAERAASQGEPELGLWSIGCAPPKNGAQAGRHRARMTGAGPCTKSTDLPETPSSADFPAPGGRTCHDFSEAVLEPDFTFGLAFHAPRRSQLQNSGPGRSPSPFRILSCFSRRALLTASRTRNATALDNPVDLLLQPGKFLIAESIKWVIDLMFADLPFHRDLGRLKPPPRVATQLLRAQVWGSGRRQQLEIPEQPGHLSEQAHAEPFDNLRLREQRRNDSLMYAQRSTDLTVWLPFDVQLTCLLNQSLWLPGSTVLALVLCRHSSTSQPCIAWRDLGMSTALTCSNGRIRF